MFSYLLLIQVSQIRTGTILFSWSAVETKGTKQKADLRFGWTCLSHAAAVYTGKDAAESSPPFQLLVFQAPGHEEKQVHIFLGSWPWRPRERMTHKRLPVSAVLPQGHTLELNSVVAHPSDLQRIRDSKQQKSLQPVPNGRKEGQHFPKTFKPRQREELLSSGMLQARGNLFPARSFARFVASSRSYSDSLGKQEPVLGCMAERAWPTSV